MNLDADLHFKSHLCAHLYHATTIPENNRTLHLTLTPQWKFTIFINWVDTGELICAESPVKFENKGKISQRRAKTSNRGQ